MTPDEAVQAAIDYELEHRRWLRALQPYVCDQLPPADSPAVEFSRNLVRLAAAARVCRILRSDQSAAARAAEASSAETALSLEG